MAAKEQKDDQLNQAIQAQLNSSAKDESSKSETSPDTQTAEVESQPTSEGETTDEPDTAKAQAEQASEPEDESQGETDAAQAALDAALSGLKMQSEAQQPKAQPEAEPEVEKPEGVAKSSKAVEATPKGSLFSVFVVRGVLLGVIVGSVLGLMIWSVTLGAPEVPSQPETLPKPSDPVANPPETHQVQSEQVQAPQVQAPQVQSQQVQSDKVVQQQVSISWKLAEQKYAAREYQQAMQGFSSLLSVSQGTPANEHISDLFRLRIAQCMRQLGQSEQARKSFRSLWPSSSPAVSASASYAIAQMDFADKQYMQARTWAYRAIAKLGSVEASSALRKECNFLIAKALTEKVFKFYSEQHGISWLRINHEDIFSNLDETALRSLLDEGRENYVQALLGPQIREVSRPSAVRAWSVSATRLPLEELLSVFATKIDIDLRWVSVSVQARSRPVTLSYLGSSEQQFFSIACGANGFLARFTGDEVLIYHPLGLASLTEQRDLLLSETISVWRRLFLRLPDDKRIAQGHLALAILYELTNDSSSAIREYQLTSNRYPNSRVAPLALLRMAKLRIRLRDYPSARRDLLDLVDRYPDCDSLDEAYLNLGRANMNSGKLPEAIRILNKLYYLELSLASRTESCLLLAKCFSEQEEYDKARKWLRNYFDLAKDLQADESADAYILLAKCELGRGEPENAARALVGALAAKPNTLKRTRALLDLTRIQAEQECFDDVINKLARIGEQDLSEPQKLELLLLTTKVYRTMGLSERAVAALNDNVVSSFPNPQDQASLRVELARCYIDLDKLKLARQLLGDNLYTLPPDRYRYQATCDLAEICLKLNKIEDTITVVSELLNSSCDSVSRRRALNILASAYVVKHDYDTAALALADMLGERQGDAQ